MVNFNDLLKEKTKLEDEARGLAIKIDSASLNQDEKLDAESEYLKIKMRINDIERNGAFKKSVAVSAGDLIDKVKNSPTIPRYETGIRGLDEALHGGIEVGTLVQLAGQSFTGKTHLTLEILSNVSRHKEVLFFNFEMGDRRIANRLDSIFDTPAQRSNMLIDSYTRNLDAICRSIEYYANKGIKFFAIDSKMKIEVPDEKEDFKKFGAITAALSKVTQQHEVIVFLINQMSEDDIKTGRMAFKGSGDQMYDSDIALFYTLLDSKNPDGARKLSFRKNRQDERNYILEMRLGEDGKTVGKMITKNIPATMHQDRNGRYVAAPTHEATYKMPENIA